MQRLVLARAQLGRVIWFWIGFAGFLAAAIFVFTQAAPFFPEVSERDLESAAVVVAAIAYGVFLSKPWRWNWRRLQQSRIYGWAFWGLALFIALWAVVRLIRWMWVSPLPLP